MSSLTDKVDELIEIFNEVKGEVRRRDDLLYERWKASGFLVDSGIISMYPNIEQVVERLEEEEDFEDEEWEEE